MMRWLLIGIVLILVIVALHDGGKHFNATSDLNTSTDVIAGWASVNAHAMPQQQFATEIAEQAAANETTVTQYTLEPQQIHLWTEMTVTGTWVIGPYFAMSRGVPLREAIGANYVIRKEKIADYFR
jgi:hypothetical protein